MIVKLTKYRHIMALTTIVALAAALIPATAVHAQDDPQPDRRTISVTGTGQASGAPDIAYVQLGVEIRNADVGAAVAEANTTMQSVTDALIAAGIAQEDLRTAQFNVRQERHSQPMPATDSGAATSGMTPSQQAQPQEPQSVYVVQNTLRVTVRDTAQISDIIQTGLDAGANNVYGLNFGLENPDELENTARERAVQDAQARAEALASNFGMTLGQPVTIREGGSGGGIPVEGAMMARDSSVPISQGALSVGVQITVTYELLP